MVSAAVVNDGAVVLLEKIDAPLPGSVYGPYAATLGESGTGDPLIAVQSLNFDVPRPIDIGDPSSFQNGRRGYSDFCPFDQAVCESYWAGSEDRQDGIRSWRQNETGIVSGDYNYAIYTPFRQITLGTLSSGANTPFSAYDGTDPAAFKSDNHARRFYYDVDTGIDYLASSGASPFTNESQRQRIFQRRALVTDSSGSVNYQLLPFNVDVNQGGFSDAFDIKRISEPGSETSQLIAIGQASVGYGDDSGRFGRCYNSTQVDSISSYNELVNCPGLDTQAVFWPLNAQGEVIPEFLMDTSVRRGYLDDGDANLRTGIGRSVNKYGVAVGISTIKRYNFSIRSHRAVVFSPAFTNGQVTYPNSPVEIFKARQGFDDEERKMFHTDAQLITDTHYDPGTQTMLETDGVSNRNFLIAGTRIHAESRNMNRADEFWVYEYVTGTIRFPLFDTMVDGIRLTGANSRVTDMNNQGLMVGYGDGYNQTQPTQNGSPRVQRAFVYDYKENKTYPLDSLSCYVDAQGNIQQPRFLITEAVGITNSVDGSSAQVLATGFEYQTDEDYIKRQNSTAVLLSLTLNLVDNRIDSSKIVDCSQSSIGQKQLADSNYTRKGAGAGMGILSVLALGLWWRRRH